MPMQAPSMPTPLGPSLRRQLVDRNTYNGYASSVPPNAVEDGRSIVGENLAGVEGGRPRTKRGSLPVAFASQRDYPKRKGEEEEYMD
ncbi:hypothetical protein OsJ_11362 [Oryza sativa Japonica Group]|jgi:hypothetical protein|nr:hypothetical protein OsJ_11362 [Oryza sativa Japonica Group]